MSSAISQRSNGPLSDAQLRQYREQGFALLGSVMDAATLAALRAEEARFRGDPGIDSQGNVMPPEKTIFRSQLARYSEPLRLFASSGGHLPAVLQLVGANVAAWFNQMVTKMPDAGDGRLAEFPWHQDNGYAAVDPATNVTVWCALDDVDERNGCVWVMPGSHQNGVLPHRSRKDSWTLDLAVEGDGIPVPLRAGEAVLFSGLTLHRSKANRTDRPRRAFFMEYLDAIGVTGPERTPVTKSLDAWMVAGAIPYPHAGKRPG